MTGPEMKAIRKGMKLRQAQVAKLVGISSTLYSDYERGYKPMNPDMAARFQAVVAQTAREGGGQP